MRIYVTLSRLGLTVEFWYDEPVLTTGGVWKHPHCPDSPKEYAPPFHTMPVATFRELFPSQQLEEGEVCRLKRVR